MNTLSRKAVARPQRYGLVAPDPIRRWMRRLLYRTLMPSKQLVPCYVRAARNVP